MRIAVIRLSAVEYSVDSPNIYNDQDIGLAKALAKQVDEVLVYQNIFGECQGRTQKIADNVTIYRIPVFHLGANGFTNLKIVDKKVDAIVLFSDTQIDTPRVIKWAKKNNIMVIPYIGIIESHSRNTFLKKLMAFAIANNISCYRKLKCLAKTPYIQEELLKRGVTDVDVMPIGLDVSRGEDISECERTSLRQAYGYEEKDKVILLVGRLVPERNPLRMIRVLDTLVKKDSNYKLLVVGKGELKERIESELESRNLKEYVQIVDYIPNEDMWKVYAAADWSIALAEKEIFGMAILEAMYYGCTVIATHAPGPDFIIEDGISGYLIETDEDIVRRIESDKIDYRVMKQRVTDNFVWDVTCNVVLDVISQYKR